MKFRIFAQGDRTVGDGTFNATVEVEDIKSDTEYEEFVRERLTRAFTDIFDAKAIVMTAEEYRRSFEPTPEEEEANSESACADGWATEREDFCRGT